MAAWGPTEEALSPEVLEAVYGVRAHLHRHAGRTFLTFSPRRAREPRDRGRVHLVCGGGTGSGLMRELIDRGYERQRRCAERARLRRGDRPRAGPADGRRGAVLRRSATTPTPRTCG